MQLALRQVALASQKLGIVRSNCVDEAPGLRSVEHVVPDPCRSPSTRSTH